MSMPVCDMVTSCWPGAQVPAAAVFLEHILEELIEGSFCTIGFCQAIRQVAAPTATSLLAFAVSGFAGLDAGAGI
jgi:hypothetical protein